MAVSFRMTTDCGAISSSRLVFLNKVSILCIANAPIMKCFQYAECYSSAVLLSKARMMLTQVVAFAII